MFLPFGNKTNSGINNLFMTIANVPLPFPLEKGVALATLRWAYTEWCTSYLIDGKVVQIRKFSNANSAGMSSHRGAIYVKGKFII